MKDPFTQKLLAVLVAAGIIGAAFVVPALAPAQTLLTGLASFLMGAVGIKSDGLKKTDAAPLAAILALCTASVALACGPLGSPAQTAAAVQTVQCEHFIAVFKDGAAKKYSCDQARKDARKAEPLCDLTFECPGDDLDDAGVR